MKRYFIIPHTLKRILLAPKGRSEDTRRREYILNLLLLGSMFLSLVALLSALGNVLARGSDYRGETLIFLSIPFLFFSGLYALARIRHPRVAAIIFIGTYYALATYTLAKWGILLPQGVLIYALIIVMTGVLVSSKAAFFITCLLGASLFGLRVLEMQGNLQPNLYWIHESGGIDDAIVFSATLLIILIVSWLSNREIEKSLARAHRSEASLKLERDMLETKVLERTNELKQKQREETLRLYRFAEFGQLTSGLLHDLTTPLTTISLNLELLKNREDSQTIKRALVATKRMQLYIDAARKQLSPNIKLTHFDPIKEIEEAQTIVRHASRKAHIKFVWEEKANATLYGDAIKFNQLATNLLANAIDAYENTPDTTSKLVHIRLSQLKNNLIFQIKDAGRGIPSSEHELIFLPFFTTKAEERGLGMGLAICKEVVEKDFNGSITVESAPNKGSTFTVTLPLNRHESP